MNLMDGMAREGESWSGIYSAIVSDDDRVKHVLEANKPSTSKYDGSGAGLEAAR